MEETDSSDIEKLRGGIAMALTINAGVANTKDYSSVNTGINKAGSKKSINASTLIKGSDMSDQLALRKQNAKNRAKKLISDAWDKDKSADKKLATKVEKLETNKNAIYSFEAKIRDVEKAHDELMDYYGVKPDSQEQKDLELLEKYQNNKLGFFSGEFSDEEVKRLKELQTEELTEYQKKALSYNSMKLEFQDEIDDKRIKNAILKEDIFDMEIAELKNQNMQKANSAADEIMEAASKDAAAIILQDAKDKIDEQQEKEKEEAKKKEEKEEALQEKIDAAKERRTEQEQLLDEARENRKEQQELLEGAIKADTLDNVSASGEVSESNVEFALRNIDKLLKENKLVNEDIKGIEIDLNF